MKKITFLVAMALAIVSCKSDDESGTPQAEDVSVAFQFTQNWDGTEITNSDFESTVYTNERGEVLTLSKLVYLISDITFTAADGTVYDAGDYNLIDVRNGTGLTFTPNIEIPEGTYDVSLTYGFDDEDNTDGIYLDLNSSDGSWSVPAMLGGGYHFMRMEGFYTNEASEITAFQFHNIRAAQPGTDPLVTTDTSIPVDLGQITIEQGTTIEVKMNASEWFKNPNVWNLNELYQVLMPNYVAQIMMNANGQTVFSKGAVTVEN